MNNKNNITVCLCHHTLAALGGEERMCVVLANALHKRGYKVITVMTEQMSNEQNVYKLNDGIIQYSLQRNRVERKLNRHFEQFLIWRYRHILKKHSVDIVIDVGSPKSLITAKAVEGLNIKIICWDHFSYERFRARCYYDDLKALILANKIHRLVVLTQSDVKSYEENEKEFPEKLVQQIYNPSPIQTTSYAPRQAKKVLACGRLAEQKGFDLLLDAWKDVEQKNADWELEIVGDGFSRAELERQVIDLGLKRVTLSHFTENVREKYAEAGIYVMSSRYEGFPLALLEAESMSLPMISFDCVTGPREIISHGYNGYLAEPEKPHDLAEKLLAVMNNDTLREQMGRNAFEFSRNFNIDKIQDKWENLIHEVLVSNQ